jgi:hypothetical protein
MKTKENKNELKNKTVSNERYRIKICGEIACNVAPRPIPYEEY